MLQCNWDNWWWVRFSLGAPYLWLCASAKLNKFNILNFKIGLFAAWVKQVEHFSTKLKMIFVKDVCFCACVFYVSVLA